MSRYIGVIFQLFLKLVFFSKGQIQVSVEFFKKSDSVSYFYHVFIYLFLT